MKYMLLFVSLFIAGSGFAGGSSGTSTPPARQDLQQDLMMRPSFDGGLFNKGDDIGLLTRFKLQPQMSVASGSVGNSNPPAFELDGGSSGGDTPPALRLSDADLKILRNRTKPLDATTVDGANASYNIEAGDSLDSVILKDRREAARAAVKQ